MTISALPDGVAALDHTDPLEDGYRDSLRVDLVLAAGDLPLNDCKLFICGTHLNLARSILFLLGVDLPLAHRLFGDSL